LQVVWSVTARAEFSAIIKYIAEQDGVRNAERVHAGIGETLQTLAFMPTMGRKRPDLEPESRIFSTAPWLIVYRPLPDQAGIRVQRIVDGRRNIPNVLRS
jgi:plasmid stabilization system protein ParE